MPAPRTVHEVRDRRYAAWVKAGRPHIVMADGRTIRPTGIYWSVFWYFNVGRPWVQGRKDGKGRPSQRRLRDGRKA
jgi:hypothetical protein